MNRGFIAFAVFFAGTVLSGMEYVHNGSFIGIDYLASRHRDNLQPHWYMTPHSYSAYSLVKDVEADAARAHIKIRCIKVPKVTYPKLNLFTDLVAIPEKKASVTFRARGTGQIFACIFEYIRTTNEKKPVWLRRAATMNFTSLDRDWKTYRFEYVPGSGELGKAVLCFKFRPVKGEAIDIDLTGVSVNAPAVKRDAVPAKQVIPRLKTAPVVDGKIDEKEWNGAVLLSGFKENLSRVPAPNQVKVFAGYDDKFLYLAYRVISGEPPKAAFTRHDSSVFREDSIEAVFSSMDEKQYAQIIISALGTVYDTNGRNAAPGKWNIKMNSKTARSETGWCAEMAIPLSELPVRLRENEPFKLNFFQNDPIVKSGPTRIVYSSWSVSAEPDKASSAANTVLFPVAELSPKKIAASVETGADGSLVLHAVNPGEPQKIYCEYGNAKARYGTILLDIPAGVSKFRIPYSPRNELAVVAVRDQNGNELYRNAEIFKYRLENNLSLKKYFPLGYVELASSQELPDCRIQWRINTVSKGEFQLKKGTKKPLKIPVDRLAENRKYTLSVNILDMSGASLGKCSFEVIRPGREPWFDSKLGISDRPLPPFKDISVNDDTLGFLMQSYEFRGRALPASMKSGKFEILAAPVSLKLNGRDVADSVKRTITVKRPNRVEWKGENEAVRWTGWAEEDGFTWYTVTLKKAPGKKASSLYLDIPVKKEFVKYLSPMPFFRSGGDMDGRYLYDFKPWNSLDFKQIVTVRNADRGIELTSEDARDFSRIKKVAYHQLIPQNDRVTVRMNIIDKEVPLDRERTYRFGLQTFPAKPFRMPENCYATSTYIDPRSSAWSGGKDKAQFILDLPGKILPETVELNAWWDFDPGYLHPDYHVRDYLRQHIIQFGSNALFWDAGKSGFLLRSGKKLLTPVRPMPLKPAKGWHKLALVWRENGLQIQLDGQPAAEFSVPALKQKFSQIRLGKSRMDQHADFHYESLRITKPGNGKIWFEQSFTADAKISGKIIGTPRTVETERGKLLSASAEYFTRLDAQYTAGVRYSLGYLGRIFAFYGPRPYGHRRQPYTNAEGYKAYGILADSMKKRNMQLYYGYSFGIRIGSREDLLYRDYYSIQPARIYGRISDGFYILCAGCLDYHNFLLYYFNDLMGRYENENIYTDNLFVSGRECCNQAHGCGYIDEHGQLQMSGNLLKGREMAKRLYGITKLRKIPREHFMHSSACNHAVYMSWTDKYLCGEQYLENTNTRNWDIDIAQYLAQNVASCFGVPAVSISTFVPFGLKGMTAVAALHNCGTAGANHHRYPNDLFEYMPFMQTTGKFGIHNAEFHPYYNNGLFVRTDQTKRQYCSFWSKNGKALFVVSNLTWKPSKTPVEFDFGKLKLKGIVRDAYGNAVFRKTGKNRIEIDLPPYDCRYLIAE